MSRRGGTFVPVVRLSGGGWAKVGGMRPGLARWGIETLRMLVAMAAAEQLAATETRLARARER